MNRCAPLGRESVELSGSVELFVMRQGDSMTAIVMPDGLHVDSHLGRAWLQGPFATEASLSRKAPHQVGAQPHQHAALAAWRSMKEALL